MNPERFELTFLIVDFTYKKNVTIIVVNEKALICIFYILFKCFSVKLLIMYLYKTLKSFVT